MTGWHRHKTIWLGGRFLASAEYFKDSRPVRELDRVGTIRTGYGPTVEIAEAELEAQL